MEKVLRYIYNLPVLPHHSHGSVDWIGTLCDHQIHLKILRYAKKKTVVFVHMVVI